MHAVPKIDIRLGAAVVLAAVAGLLVAGTARAQADPAPTLPFTANVSSTIGTVANSAAEAFDPGNATLTGVASTSAIDLNATGGANGGSFELRLTPEAGTTLHVGTYRILRDPHAPQMTVVFDGPQVSGNESDELQIRDLAADGTGKITRLDLTFLAQQNLAAHSVFGEVRLGEPVAAGHIDSASIMPWPLVPAGSVGVPASDWVHNTSAVPETVGTPTLTGARSDQFSITRNGCSAVLAPGASCAITVAFAPTVGAHDQPDLRFTVNGTPDVVGLDATAPSGYTGWVSTGDVFINHSGTVAINDSAEQISVQGGRQDLQVISRPIYGAGIELGTQIAAPAGQTLAVGVHQIDGFEKSSYSIFLGVGGRGCDNFAGTEDIRSISFDTRGVLTSLDLTFRGRCDQETSEVTGSFQYRVPISLTLTPSATVTSGQRAALTGTAPPGAVLQVFEHSRTAIGYAASGTVTADVAGHYSYGFLAADDARLYTRLNGVDSPSALVQIWPGITGAATRTVPSGNYTLTGTGAPRTSVQLHFHRTGDPAGSYPVVRSVPVSAAGTWSRTYAATVDNRIYASSTVNHTASPAVLVQAR